MHYLGAASPRLFTAAQAAQKVRGALLADFSQFTAAQAAQKLHMSSSSWLARFTAAQAAQKRCGRLEPQGRGSLPHRQLRKVRR